MRVYVNSCKLRFPFPLHSNRREPSVKKSKLLKALQQEILWRDFDYFVDEPPSIAQGGRGLVVASAGRRPYSVVRNPIYLGMFGAAPRANYAAQPPFAPAITTAVTQSEMAGSPHGTSLPSRVHRLSVRPWHQLGRTPFAYFAY